MNFGPFGLKLFGGVSFIGLIMILLHFLILSLFYIIIAFPTLLLLNNVTTYSYKLLVKSTRPTFSCYPIMAIDEVSWALKDTVTDVDISFLVIHFVNNYIRWKCHDQGFLSIYLSYSSDYNSDCYDTMQSI
jgi:hypothetical protein